MPSDMMTSVVKPCEVLGRTCGDRRSQPSAWLWRSMKPGATIFPRASICVGAEAEARSPMDVIRSAEIPTSARMRGEPDPSITWPLRIMMSKVMLGAFGLNVTEFR